MNRLPYLGLCVRGESPRGYLLRTAHNNGYTTLGLFAARLEADPNPGLISSLIGKTDIAEKLIKLHDEYAENIKEVFYEQIKGVTKTTDIIISKNKVPYKILRSSGHHICWQCLRENKHIAVSFDIDVIDVCTRHKSYLQHDCKTCSKPYNWRNTEHKTCNCPRTESDVVLVEGCHGAERVALAVNNSEYQFLTKLLDLLKALRHHKSDDKIERNNTLNLATRMLDGSSEVFTNYLSQERKKHPGIPLRVLISPLIALGHEDINSKITESLKLFPEEYPSECDNCECDSKYLTTHEATICLEITNATLNRLCQNQLINDSLRGKTRVFPYKNMCHFFRQLNPSSIAEKVTENLQPISYTAPGNSLIEKLKDVISGKKSTITVNQTKGLSGVLLVEVPSIVNLQKERLDLMTTSQVASYLNVYKDAIRSISKTELLPPTLMVSTQPFFSVESVENFDLKYVFAASLAKKYGIGGKQITHSLRQNNISEVSGPETDGTLTPLYKRDELEKHDLFSIQYTNFRERHSHDTKATRTDVPQHLTAKSIAKSLGIRVSMITKIEKYGLLNQTSLNIKNDRRRFYNPDSLDITLQWFKKAKRLDEFSEEIGVNKWHLARLFISTRYVQPLKLSNDYQLLSPGDQKKIKEHLSIFCTCSEADKYHNAPDKHFHNLVKSNRFPVVSKEDYLCDTEMILLYWKDVKSYSY